MVAVAFRTKISATANANTVSGSLNIDIGNLNNRIVIVAVGNSSGQTSSVTIDGKNATLMHEVTSAEAGSCTAVAAVWYMLDADLPAGTGNVTVQANSTLVDDFHLSASLYTGIKQQSAEAVGKTVAASEGDSSDVSVTSITANAMGFVVAVQGCAAIGDTTPPTGFTLLHSLSAAATFTVSTYDLDIGTAGAKTFNPSGGFGFPRVLGSAWETNTVPEAPAGNTNAGAIMMGASF